MSLTNFTAVVWAARLLKALEKNLIVAQAGIVNRDYEGEIAQKGDSVNIQSIGDPTIFDYTKNTDMPAPETLTDATRKLVIDKAKGFNFQVDDVDQAQGAPQTMDEAMQRSAYKLRDVADAHVLSLMAAAAGVGAIGSTATPVAIGTDQAGGDSDAYATLIRAKVKLDNALAPAEGRFAVVPSWFGALLALDDRFIGDSGSGSTLQNGVVGRAAGFNIVESPNVVNTAGTKLKILAGVNGATTYAEQINEVIAYQPEKRFGDAVKGLHLYGAKVIRPEELVVVTADDADGLNA